MRMDRPRYRRLIEIALLFLLGALFQLPLAGHFGYYGSDWYSMYAARVTGPQVFHALYGMEGQPARALFMIPLYSLFGGDPFLYVLSAYFFRISGVITFLWLLRIIWPERTRETFWGAVLFLAYPGFLSQPNAIAIQTHLLAAWMAFLSLGLSLRSVVEEHRFRRFVLAVGAILFGWLYLSQAGYLIGYEIVRLALICIIYTRQGPAKKPAMAALKGWLPFSVIPAAYIAWLLLIPSTLFASADMGLQPGGLLDQMIFLIQGTLDSALLSWLVPFAGPGFSLRLRDSLIAAGLSLVVLAAFFASLRLTADDRLDHEKPPLSFAMEAFCLGALWVLFALLPIALVASTELLNKPGYGLVGAAGAAIVMVALLVSISQKSARYIALGLLLVSAATAHYANGIRYAAQADQLSSFWWQVSWRVPQFMPGATLVVRYPDLESQDSALVWGPANLVYYPELASMDSLDAPIAAIVPDHDLVIGIFSQTTGYENFDQVLKLLPDPSHITVISRPTSSSCVQLIDGSRSEYSTYEDVTFRMLGSYSDASYVLTEPAPQKPPEFLFGPEPSRGWCYYYEKASLARQQGDWNEVLRLEAELSKESLRPDDMVEWMPFLQAYVMNGNNDKLRRMSHAIWSDMYAARQACNILLAMPGLSEETRQIIDQNYCTRP